MKNKHSLYASFGIITCIVFFYASMTGWAVWDSIQTKKWGPRGHSLVHK